MHRLEGKQVVVTGGAGALGSAVVERLAREGAAVIVPIEGDAKAGALHEQERVRTGEGDREVDKALPPPIDKLPSAPPPLRFTTPLPPLPALATPAAPTPRRRWIVAVQLVGSKT